MTPDIEAKIAVDFSLAERQEALGVLRLLEDEMGPGEHSRVLRCVVSLAQGDLTRLFHFADRATQDYRDVVYWAEYDEHNRRVRDLNLPFPEP